ncbi:MAG: CBS domain-containing protein [bacterium]|nr:CBS domain-containing protein [bacterium]
MGIKQKKVRDIMNRGVVTVSLKDSVKKVAQVLSENKIHAVAVITSGGETRGIISETDIIKHIEEDIEKLTAEDVMSSYVESIIPEASVVAAAKIMTELKYHRLLVMGKDAAVGVLAASDIVAGMAKE